MHLLDLLPAIILFGKVYSNNVNQFLGIPVPGQTVSALEIFKLFDNMCRPPDNAYEQRPSITKSLKFLSSGEELAQRAYNSLFFAVSEVKIHRLMGKWYKVITSPRVHPETCVLSYCWLGRGGEGMIGDRVHSQSDYLATFSTKDYFRSGTTVDMYEGYGTKLGPDAGQLLIDTGHPADPCPCWCHYGIVYDSIVKTGPLNSDGLYSYVILSQLLKHPIIGLARDPYEFDQKYKTEVNDFLQRNNFNNPLTSAYNTIAFANWTNCDDQFYFHLD